MLNIKLLYRVNYETGEQHGIELLNLIGHCRDIMDFIPYYNYYYYYFSVF